MNLTRFVKFNRVVIGAALTVVLSIPVACFGQSVSAPIVIKLSHVVAVDTPKGRGADYFKRLAEERTKGRVKVEVYPNSQLYKDKEEIEALQLGSVQMLAPSHSKFGPLGVKEFEILDLPFVFPNQEVVDRVADGPVGQVLLKKLEQRGIQGLAFWDGGFKSMSANRPLINVGDFRGLKMRIPSSKVGEAQMRAVGAMPQVMAFSESYSALQTGVVDGTENTLSNYYTQKLYEVQDHITLSNHGYIGYVLIANKRFWDSLPSDIREILNGAVRDATKYVRDVSQQDSDRALQKIKEHKKTKIDTLTNEQREAWRSKMTSIYPEMISRSGRDAKRVLDMIVSEYPDTSSK